MLKLNPDMTADQVLNKYREGEATMDDPMFTRDEEMNIDASTPDFLKPTLTPDDVPVFSHNDMESMVKGLSEKVTVLTERLLAAQTGIKDLRQADNELKKDIAAQDATIQRLNEEIRVKSNALMNFKRDVGVAFSEWAEELNLDDDETARMVEVFKDLGLEDYLPVKEWSVEVEVTGKAYISVRAANAELARELVKNETRTYEITQNLDESNLEWEVTGDVEEE